jgi:GNAT superfamily N-acetyltransferase
MFRYGDEIYMSKIHEEVFEETCNPKIYKAWATAANCRTIIATYREKPVGFIIAEKRRCNYLGDFQIAVEPFHHNKGVGSALLQAAFNIFIDMKVRKVIADYLMLNAPATDFIKNTVSNQKEFTTIFLYKRKLELF